MKEELRKLTDTIRYKSELLAAVTAFALDGIWAHVFTYEPDGSWAVESEYDRRYLEVFKWPREEYTSWEDHILIADLARAKKLFTDHLQSKGEIPYYLTVTYTDYEGEELRILCRGKVDKWDEQGRPLRFVGTHTVVPDE